MKGIAILRVPPGSPERDASSKAISNIINITSEISESVLVFENQFDDTEADVCEIQRKTSTNPILSAFYLLLYQIKITSRLFKSRGELDAIFLHAGGFVFILPIVFCRLSGITTIVSVIGEPHKGYENVSSGTLTDRFITFTVLYAEKFAYTVADGLVVFSEDMLSYNPISDYQSKCKRVRFNYESVPEEVPDVDSRSNSLVYLGRICELKGANRVLDAINTIYTETERDITASFVGDGNLLHQLQQRRDKQALNNVVFTGWVDAVTVDEILRNSQILVLPSRSEGLPKALLEAMARGVVPVVTPVGDVQSVIEDGVNGILLNDPSPDSIADTVIELLRSDQLQEMSENAQETVRQQFSFETAKSDFIELLKECER